MDICTGESGSLSAPSPCQPRTGVAGRISARFPDRECYPLLHPVDPVPEWQAGYLQGFRTGSVIRSFTLSAPYLRLQAGYLQGFRTGSLSAPSPYQPRTGVAGRISARFPDRECYPLLHPVDPVPEWQAGYLQGFRTGSVIRSFTLSAPYLKLQSGYLHRFRTGSLSLHPLPVRLVPGRQNICNVSGRDRYHPPHSSFTLSASYRRLISLVFPVPRLDRMVINCISSNFFNRSKNVV